MRRELLRDSGKTSFALGERVEFVLRAENEGEESVTYQFRSSCQASTSSVTGAGDHSRLEITCAQILTELELSPGEQKDFPFRWNQADHRGTPVFGRGISDRGLSCQRQRPRVAVAIRVE